VTALPPSIRREVQAALGARREGAAAITEAHAVGGGCISPTARITTDDGPFFVKWEGPDLPAGLLAAEARGLRLLHDAGEVRVPGVIALSEGRPEWLVLEWLEPGTAPRDAWFRLGTELAALHRHSSDLFGAEADNFIGSLPQANQRLGDWPAFWRDRRLEPQLRRALGLGLLHDGDRRGFDRLYSRLDDLLAPANDDGPSLLHGDLWSGNVHMTANGATIIDPSVYYGHREVDLAMAELFGGFDPEFRAAYDETWPLSPGYAPRRRAIYQLYYLLVHVNLFGIGYVSRTRDALRRSGLDP
jgi:protein-ribulosamine 3-kinase